MANFVQNSETKNAVRELTSPIPDVATFNTIVQSVITDNPFAMENNFSKNYWRRPKVFDSYMTAVENHDPVENAIQTAKQYRCC